MPGVAPRSQEVTRPPLTSVPGVVPRHGWYAYAGLMAKKLKAHFLGQRLIASARLARWELKIVGAADAALEIRKAHVLSQLRHVPRITASVSTDIFGLDSWGDDAEDDVSKSVYSVFTDIREGTAAKFGIGAADLPDIDVTTRVNNLVTHVLGIGPRTADKLTLSLTQGVNAGESMDKLADRVSAIFDTAESDAMAIARTEVNGAASGLADSYAQAVHAGGLSLQKTWLSTIDDRTRDTHIDADGQTVGMDEMFEVGASELAYPCDENADDAGEVVYCRCTVIYDEEGTEYGDDLHIDVGE